MVRANSRSADDDQLRLTAKARERLKAVILDANAYGMARPDFQHLARLASRLAGIGIETWVPEPVAWEWAEHVARDWQVAKNAAKQERDRLKNAGLEVDVPRAIYGSREEVIGAVLANLSAIPHVKVTELTGASSVEALKDQVLQRKPAKVKGDPPVKTGASDSAWLRDVLDRLEPEEFLIVSSDGDVRAAFQAWGRQQPLIRAREKLRPTLFGVTVDDGHARLSIMRYLLERLSVGDADDGGLDIGRIVGLESEIQHRRDGDGSSLSMYGASVTRINAIAGLGDVTVERGVLERASASDLSERGSGRRDDLGSVTYDVAYATAFFLAEGEATVQTLFNGGDPEVSVLEYDNVLVRAQLSFHFADGVITTVAAEADAEAMLVESTYDDHDDAVRALAEALTCIPGLELDVDSIGHAGADLRGTVEGAHAHIEVDMTRGGGDWKMAVALWRGTSSDEELQPEGDIEVECTYDPSSWWGGSRDGLQGPDGYRVSVYGPGLRSTYGIWSVPAWIIDRIDWSTFTATGVSGRDQPA